MKYAMIVEQAEDGCDYMIGCGVRVDTFDADNDIAAASYVRTTMLDRGEASGSFLAGEHREQTYRSATLVRIVADLPLAAWRAELADAACREATAAREAEERAEFARLAAKFGGVP